MAEMLEPELLGLDFQELTALVQKHGQPPYRARQLFQAINQVETQQRLRGGEDVPAPLNLHISHDVSSVSDENGS